MWKQERLGVVFDIGIVGRTQQSTMTATTRAMNGTAKKHRPPMLPLSSSPPPFSPVSNSPITFEDPPFSSGIAGDDDALSSELALLESLRNNVKKNLSLRPLPSPHSPLPSPLRISGKKGSTPSSPSLLSFRLKDPYTYPNGEVESPVSAYNPQNDIPVPRTPLSPFDISLYTQPSPPSSPGRRSDSIDALPSLSSSASTSLSESDPLPASTSNGGPYPMTPDTLFQTLSSPPYPLLLDTRPAGPYLASRIRNSINLAIPSLILKRCRKQSTSHAFNDIHALKAFVTTERGQEDWDYLVGSESGEADDELHHTSAGGLGHAPSPSQAQSISPPDNRHPARWNGDIIVYDDEMDERDPLAPQSAAKQIPGVTSNTAWTLLSVLTPMRAGQPGCVYYLKGGLSAARSHPSNRAYFIESAGSGDAQNERGGESPRIRAVHPSTPTTTSLNSPLAIPIIGLPPDPTTEGPRSSDPAGHSPVAGSGGVTTSAAPSYYTSDRRPLGGGVGGGGLFSLRTDVAARSKPMPEIEPPTTSSPNALPRTPRSPRPLTLAPLPTLLDNSPSPSPSTTTSNLAFPRSPIRSRSNTGMLPKLAKLDTRSRDRLVLPSLTINTEGVNTNGPQQPPKLSVRTQPLKAATLAAPIASPLVSDFGLNNHPPPSPNGRRAFNYAPSPVSPQSGISQFYTPVQTPSDFPFLYPRSSTSSPSHLQAPSTPLTARPPLSPSTLESAALPPFAISTILPGFLFLGPEITTPQQVEELESLGVRRILNTAAECDDDLGLGLRRRFDRYVKISMRDTVEEENVGRAAREVCEFLDDARLHSSPTYVHCKAGKSRSVTMVMAYLIHANHWPLSRAYSFVLERRKGVSPNIGFVSELMTFEEQELGGKSVGVVKDGEGDHGNNGGGKGGNFSHLAGGRRAAHVRESLPPAFHYAQSSADVGHPLSAQGPGTGGLGADVGEEMEVKDADGRYRHARRAPVNELTLQPLRRVSKAGLESSWV